MEQKVPMPLHKITLYAAVYGLILPAIVFMFPLFKIFAALWTEYFHRILELGPFWFCYLLPYFIAWFITSAVLFFGIWLDEKQRAERQAEDEPEAITA